MGCIAIKLIREQSHDMTCDFPTLQTCIQSFTDLIIYMHVFRCMQYLLHFAFDPYIDPLSRLKYRWQDGADLYQSC